MSYDDIQTAAVIRYPYLWARQAHAGETEGRKDRPVAVGVRISRPDGDLVLFFPITSKQPETSRFSAEIPGIEKRRAGLDASGSSSTNSTATGSGSPFIWRRIRRSDASARLSFCRSCASSSPAAKPSPRSVASGSVGASIAAAVFCPGEALECVRRLVTSVEGLHHGLAVRTDTAPIPNDGGAAEKGRLDCERIETPHVSSAAGFLLRAPRRRRMSPNTLSRGAALP